MHHPFGGENTEPPPPRDKSQLQMVWQRIRQHPLARVGPGLITGVADDDPVVWLGRAARTRPELADAVLDALDSIETPMAGKVAEGLRGR